MKDKKQIAAISAVMALINGESKGYGYTEPIRGLPSHPYAANGRQFTMQYRDITQRRIIKRVR